MIAIAKRERKRENKTINLKPLLQPANRKFKTTKKHFAQYHALRRTPAPNLATRLAMHGSFEDHRNWLLQQYDRQVTEIQYKQPLEQPSAHQLEHQSEQASEAQAEARDITDDLTNNVNENFESRKKARRPRKKNPETSGSRSEGMRALPQNDSTPPKTDSDDFIAHVASGDTLVAENYLYEHSISINKRDAKGYTALHYAVKQHNKGLVKTLLMHGADPYAIVLASDKQNHEKENHAIAVASVSDDCLSLLFEAAQTWDATKGKSSEDMLRVLKNLYDMSKIQGQNRLAYLEKARYIVNKKGTDGITPAEEALKIPDTEADQEFITFLQEAGAQFSHDEVSEQATLTEQLKQYIQRNLLAKFTAAISPSEMQVFLKGSEAVSSPLSDNQIKELLKYAISQNNQEVVQILLSERISLENIHITQDKALLKAAMGTKNPALVALCIDAGADLSQFIPFLRNKLNLKEEDIEEWKIAQRKFEEAAPANRQLLRTALETWETQYDTKEDIAQELSNTPNYKRLEALLKKADFTHPVFKLKGKEESYVQQYVASTKKPKIKIIKLLASHGANLNAIGESGQTALMHAAQDPKKTHLIKQLVTLGACVDIKYNKEQSALTLLEDEIRKPGRLGFHPIPSLYYWGGKVKSGFSPLTRTILNKYNGLFPGHFSTTSKIIATPFLPLYWLWALCKKVYSWYAGPGHKTGEKRWSWYRPIVNIQLGFKNTRPRLPIFSSRTPLYRAYQLLSATSGENTERESQENDPAVFKAMNYKEELEVEDNEKKSVLEAMQEKLIHALLHVNYKQFDMIAIQSGNILNAPIKVQLPNDSEYHSNPLTMVVIAQNREALRMLLKTKKVDLNNADDYGKSALHCGVLGGDIEIVKMLLKARCKISNCSKILVNKADTKGVTPLMLAVEQGDLSMVRLLVRHGANINLTDHMGSGAIDRALKSAQGDDLHSNEVLDFLLLQKGAKLHFRVYNAMSDCTFQKVMHPQERKMVGQSQNQSQKQNQKRAVKEVAEGGEVKPLSSHELGVVNYNKQPVAKQGRAPKRRGVVEMPNAADSPFAAPPIAPKTRVFKNRLDF